MKRGDSVLVLISADVELSFIIDNGEPQLLQPSVPTEYVAVESLHSCKINHCIKLKTEREKRYLMSVAEELSCGCSKPFLYTAFDIKPQCLAILLLKYTMRGSGI